MESSKLDNYYKNFMVGEIICHLLSKAIFSSYRESGHLLIEVNFLTIKSRT